MPDTLLSAFQVDGLYWLIIAVVAAGLVRGFSGFGSAMIIMPAASSVLSPVEAVIFVVAAEILGPIPNIRAALREGSPRDVGVLMIGAVMALPLGLLCLSLLDPLIFSWIISGIVFVLLILLITGWRYQGALTRPLTLATGGLGGFMTGFAGIPGPPVIMLYMASKLPIAMIRANLMLYLFFIDLLLFPILWLMGLMVWKWAFLGFVLGFGNLIGNRIGAMFFDPGAEALFRKVAYCVILASAILGLPIWKG